MSVGYFIGLSDKTTCGGKVLDGDTRLMMYGLAHAREGDRVTCGEDGEIYRIVGGISHMTSHGKHVAGTLDSYSSCPCEARLIPSVFTATYRNAPKPAQQAPSRVAQPTAPVASSNPGAPQQSAYSPAANPIPPVFNSVDPQEPGFYIVPKSMSRVALEASLFLNPDPAVVSKFRALNPGLGDFKAGSLIVLSDPNNSSCTRQEAMLMEAAQQVLTDLEPLTPEEADFMVRHFGEIKSFLTHAAISIGAGEAMFARNLDDVRGLLLDIESLHQRAYLQDGHLRSTNFFAERKRLFSQLDLHLTSLTRKGTGIPDHPNLKSALGISNRSLVHRWSTVGVDKIPGYTTHLNGVAKASRYVKYGGWLGITLGGGASYMNVHDVCTAGDAEACEWVKFTEAGSFLGGIAGGAAVGAGVSGAAVGAICAGFGVPTGGLSLLICGLVVVGGASIGGGWLGGKVGEGVGDLVYEAGK